MICFTLDLYILRAMLYSLPSMEVIMFKHYHQRVAMLGYVRYFYATLKET